MRPSVPSPRWRSCARVCDDQPRSLQAINPAIPVWLAAIIAKLHAKNPADRFQNAGEVADLLGQCLADVRQPDAVPLPVPAAACGVAKRKRDRRRGASTYWLRRGVTRRCVCMDPA